MSDEATPPVSTNVDEIQVLGNVLAALQRLEPEARARILHTIGTYFGIGTRVVSSQAGTLAGNGTSSSFSEDRSISPKDFIMQKQPRSDVEKVACLAFYLTHYRDTNHFKTLDISQLNTEAAQVKFSNAAVAVDNATRKGFIVPLGKGQKQLSAIGEQFVLALPDRDAAQAAFSNMRRRRKTRKFNPDDSEESGTDKNAQPRT